MDRMKLSPALLMEQRRQNNKIQIMEESGDDKTSTLKDALSEVEKFDQM